MTMQLKNRDPSWMFQLPAEVIALYNDTPSVRLPPGGALLLYDDLVFKSLAVHNDGKDGKPRKQYVQILGNEELHNSNPEYASAIMHVAEHWFYASMIIAEQMFMKIKPTNVSEFVNNVLVLPDDGFSKVLDFLKTPLPPGFTWATNNVRGTFAKHLGGKDTHLIKASAVFDFKIFQPGMWLTEEQADKQRELTHELLHLTQHSFRIFDDKRMVLFREMMSEGFGRLIEQNKGQHPLQCFMPESTKFLTSLKVMPDTNPRIPQILTMGQMLDKFGHSMEPVATNHSYGSATLLMAGVLESFIQIYNVNYHEAMTGFFNIMLSSKNADEMVTNLADKLGMTERQLLHGYGLQELGQSVLREHYKPIPKPMGMWVSEKVESVVQKLESIVTDLGQTNGRMGPRY